MIRGFLLLSIGAILYAGSEYVPLSEFSENQQIEHNFKKVEIINNKKIEQVKQIKKIEIKKPIVIQTKQEKEKVVQRTMYKQDILYSARLTYSPLSAEYSNSTISDSSKSNSIEPSGSVSFGKHKIEASYFNSENNFNSSNVETTLYKLAYKHKYKNVNIGLAANHLLIDSDTNKEKETFPSLEVDFKNSSEFIDLEYGASIGKNDSVDYSYEYFFNVNVKPSVNSDESLVIGYKNRTIQLKENDEKLEFTGPFIGINTKF